MSYGKKTIKLKIECLCSKLKLPALAAKDNESCHHFHHPHRNIHQQQTMKQTQCLNVFVSQTLTQNELILNKQDF